VIAFLLALAVGAPDVKSSSDITVAHSRLQRLSLQVDTDDNGKITTCRASVSSGDATFDTAACEATKACVNDGAKAGDELAGCVDNRLVALVRAGRQGQGLKNGNDAQD